MFIKNRKAFTMIELVFVIVVIGILGAIAIPKFSGTADSAYLTKAQDTLAGVRSALMAERQKRVLRGTFTPITDLSLQSDGTASTNVFDHFSSDGGNPPNFAPLFDYPIRGCTANAQRACWRRIAPAGATPLTYAYIFPDPGMGVDGQADFIIDNNNKFVCRDANETADCQLILNE